LVPRLASQAVDPIILLGHVGYFPVLLPKVDKGDAENPVIYPCPVTESLIGVND